MPAVLPVMALGISKNEQGMIRVFAVNRAPAVMTGALKSLGKTRLAADLLGQRVAGTGVELFPVADLSGVGLAGYLADGYSVPQAQLKADRSKLEGLDGYVLLVFSAAFEGRAMTLEPGADLTLIGTYGETQPDMSVHPLESEAAQPYSGLPALPPETPQNKRPSGSLTIAVLIAIAGLVLWWALR